MTVFWNVSPCSLVETDPVSQLLTVPIIKAMFAMMTEAVNRSDYGGSKHRWYVSQFLRDYTAQQHIRQSSSYTQPWEPEISPSNDGFLPRPSQFIIRYHIPAQCCTNHAVEKVSIIWQTCATAEVTKRGRVNGSIIMDDEFEGCRMKSRDLFEDTNPTIARRHWRKLRVM
jgi:hypothetical protein